MIRSPVRTNVQLWIFIHGFAVYFLYSMVMKILITHNTSAHLSITDKLYRTFFLTTKKLFFFKNMTANKKENKEANRQKK